MKDQRKGSEAPRLSKVGSVGIPIEQFPERSRASLIKFDTTSRWASTRSTASAMTQTSEGSPVKERQ